MKINITARHFKAKESLQKYTSEKLDLLGKYNEDILHADVIFSYVKPPINHKHCEIIIKLKDKTMTATEFSDEFDKAIDKSLEKIETQLYKYKDKNKTQKHVSDKYKSI
jgi:putative sigma-54 modulation protein